MYVLLALCVMMTAGWDGVAYRARFLSSKIRFGAAFPRAIVRLLDQYTVRPMSKKYSKLEGSKMSK